MVATISVTAPANGTVMLSSTFRESDSTAAQRTAAMRIAIHVAPASAGGRSQALAASALTNPAAANVSDPPQLFSRFHGRRAIGIVLPAIVARPSPNARIAQR